MWRVFKEAGENEPIERWLTPDYIELRNTGESEIDLSGLAIGQSFFDEEEDFFHFQDGTVIAPGEHLIVYFSDYNLGLDHANFTLRKNGEQVYLVGSTEAGSRSLIDTVKTGVLDDDEAQFRIGNLDGWFTGEATPGTTNFTGSQDFFVTSDSIALVFVTERGKSYTIYESNTLTPDSWQSVSEVTGNGYEHAYQAPRDSGEAYFRVETSEAPEIE